MKHIRNSRSRRRTVSYQPVRPISAHGVNYKILETVEIFKNYDFSIDPGVWWVKVEAEVTLKIPEGLVCNSVKVQGYVRDKRVKIDRF